jgi:hypothetical protein
MRRKGLIPISCIECLKADCFGHCKILNDRQEDYAIKRHKNCPIERRANEEKETTLQTK